MVAAGQTCYIRVCLGSMRNARLASSNRADRFAINSMSLLKRLTVLRMNERTDMLLRRPPQSMQDKIMVALPAAAVEATAVMAGVEPIAAAEPAVAVAVTRKTM